MSLVVKRGIYAQESKLTNAKENLVREVTAFLAKHDFRKDACVLHLCLPSSMYTYNTLKEADFPQDKVIAFSNKTTRESIVNSYIETELDMSLSAHSVSVFSYDTLNLHTFVSISLRELQKWVIEPLKNNDFLIGGVHIREDALNQLVKAKLKPNSRGHVIINFSAKGASEVMSIYLFRRDFLIASRELPLSSYDILSLVTEIQLMEANIKEKISDFDIEEYFATSSDGEDLGIISDLFTPVVTFKGDYLVTEAMNVGNET